MNPGLVTVLLRDTYVASNSFAIKTRTFFSPDKKLRQNK